MKEQILKILNNYLRFDEDGNIYGDEQVAEKITAHVFEFIEWIGKKGVERYNEDENEVWYLYVRNSMEIASKFYSINEIYQYWLTNFKNVAKWKDI